MTTPERAGMVTHEFAQEAVQSVGLCGAISPDGESICIRYENHPCCHGWENEHGR